MSLRAAVFGVAVAVAGAGFVPTARGQVAANRAAAPAVVSDLALTPALEVAKRRKKLLVVVAGENAGQLRTNLAPLSSPVLASWARAHAIVIGVEDRASLRLLAGEGLRVGGPEQPMLFKDGLQALIVGTAPEQNTSRLRPTPPAALPAGGLKTPEDRAALAALRLALRLEFTRRGIGSRDAAWWKAHDQPAALEPLATFADRAEGGVPAFGEVAPPDGAAADDVVARLRQAVGLIDAGEDARAAAVCTWLIEHETLDATATPAIRAVLPAFMRTLAQRSPEARGRFGAMWAAREERLWAFDSRELFAALMLARVVGPAGGARDLAILDLLDAMLSDGDAVIVMAPRDRMDLELMLPRIAPVDPLTLPSTGVPASRFVRRGIELLKAPRLKQVPAEQWSAAMRFRAGMMLDEACRLHVALLRAGKDDEAQAIRGPLQTLAAGGPGQASGDVLLATAAYAAGVAKPFHAEWLKEAGDAASRRLLARLRP